MICINGTLAGMVSMCAGCNNLHQGAAVGIGAMAGITIILSSNLLKHFQIDDPLDAFAVHYGGGLVGVLATPVFMRNGIVNSVLCGDQEAEYLRIFPTGEGFQCDYFEYKVWAWNLAGLLAITLWAGGLSALVFYSLKFAGILR